MLHSLARGRLDLQLMRSRQAAAVLVKGAHVRFTVKLVIALVLAFFLRGLLTMGFQQAFGRPMLAAAGWQAGTRPPTSYMTASILAALVACSLAGIGAALVVGRARFRTTLGFATLFCALALVSNRTTLFSHPHPYEWPLLLTPLLAMPLGAWVVVRWKPLAPAGYAGS